jgi:hypothetical protein
MSQAALSYLTPSKRREWLPGDELTRRQASTYLGKIGYPMTVRALEKRASNDNAGKGPPFIRKSWKCVRYVRSDLDAWAAAQSERIA